MPNNRNLRDSQLKVTKALPASTTATATDPIDLGSGTRGDFVAEVQFLATVPALTTAQLPDTKTMTYTVETDDNAAFTSAKVVVQLAGLTQTGATSAGAVGSTQTWVPSTDTEEFVRLKATPSASGTGDASGASMTLEVLS